VNDPLVIEYVFDGHKRGYNFTSPTRGLDDAVLKTVWRQAMPRGQGWGATPFIGAKSLKCFPVSERVVALSSVVVTDLADEGGRRGIRRAEIRLMTSDECIEQLRAQLAAYAEPIQTRLERLPTLGQWKRIVDEMLPKVRRDAQAVLTAPYAGPDSWLLVEALILKIVTSRKLTLTSHRKLVPFTTLALNYHDESPLVAIPNAQIAHVEGIAPILLFGD
jgi:hypothetical protein